MGRAASRTSCFSMNRPPIAIGFPKASLCSCGISMAQRRAFCPTRAMGRERIRRRIGRALNTGSACDGKMLTFSFHADSEDCIRCYMYTMGQMMRFMPKDIMAVLPKFFVDNEKNKSWLKMEGKDGPQKKIEEMEKLLVDDRFNAFYESC